MTETKQISIPEGRDAWEAALEGSKYRDSEFTTVSGESLEAAYGPEDAPDGVPEAVPRVLRGCSRG